MSARPITGAYRIESLDEPTPATLVLMRCVRPTLSSAAKLHSSRASAAALFDGGAKTVLSLHWAT